MFIARLHQCSRKQNLVHNQIEKKKTNKTYVFHLNWSINMKLSPLSSDPPLQKDSQNKFFYAVPPFPFPFRFLLSPFFPKEPLNRSRNPIPVWRKSQIFRLQLTDDFDPFNFIIRTFGKLQSCSPLS